MADKENEDPQTNDEIIDPMTQQRKFPDTGRNDAQWKEAGRRSPAEIFQRKKLPNNLQGSKKNVALIFQKL